MLRHDYVALFDRIERLGADARLHRLTGPDAGAVSPWDGRVESLPGRPVRLYGTACRETADGLVYAESLMGRPRLLVLGAGHVGTAVTAIGAMLGFHVVVIDARPQFADPARLSGADEVICAPYAEAIAALPDHANSYVVIVTPGHVLDRECAVVCLRRPHEYVGMIGSGAKVATVRAALAERGFTAAQLDSLHAPIGLPLGGREPAEIAVAICAELVQVRSARGARVFDPAVRSAVLTLVANPPARATLATIVGHGGSAPRGTGSRMLVSDDGAIVGSVGGGAVEAAVIAQGRDMAGTPGAVDLVDHDLSDREGAELGMICGGRIRVLLEAL